MLKYLLTLFLIVSTLQAGEKTGTSVYLNLGLNYNTHTTDIKGFSGFENCCDEFTGGNMLAPNFGVGVDFYLGDLLFGLPTTYSLGLRYNDLSSSYTEERFRGYLIREFDKDEIIVEHQLDPTFNAIALENSIYTKLIDELSFGIGVGIGFVTTSDFSQNEVALSPSDFTFNNGEREINTGEGSITEANSMLFSLLAGLRYNVYTTDNWTIRPEIAFNFIPGSMLTDEDLNVSQLSGGISIVYHFTEEDSKPIPPPPPPPAEEIITDTVAPAPPAPPRIEVDMAMYDEDNNEIKDGAEYFIPANIYESKHEYALKTIVFFDSAEVDYKDYNISSFTQNDFDVQTEMILAVANKMKRDESLSLELVSYQLDDEDNSLSKSRLEKIKTKLSEFGVDLSRVSERTITNNDDFKYSELKEELRKVELNLSDNSELIKSIYEIDSRVELQNMSFVPKVEVDSDRDDYYQEANLYLDGEAIETKGKNFAFEIDGKIADAIKANGEAKIEYISSAEIAGIYASDKTEFTIKPKVEKVVESLNTLEEGNKVQEQHILAYTDFDESQLKSVDNKVLDMAKKAVKEGRNVIVYASTDNLGNKEYNQALAERRANAAKRIIGTGKGNVNIVYPEGYLFSNEHPYGRMLNRAIVIRIEK